MVKAAACAADSLSAAAEGCRGVYDAVATWCPARLDVTGDTYPTVCGRPLGVR